MLRPSSEKRHPYQAAVTLSTAYEEGGPATAVQYAEKSRVTLSMCLHGLRRRGAHLA